MAARWLQQKLTKQKRMRRAHLKGYSMGRPKGPPPEPGSNDDHSRGGFVGVGFASRNRAAQVNLHVDTMSIFLRETFSKRSYENRYVRLNGLHTDLEPIVAKMAQSKINAGSLQGERHYVYKVMDKITNHEVRLYIAGDDCFFVSETRTISQMVYKVSAEYDRTRFAVLAFERDDILWEYVERRPLPDG